MPTADRASERPTDADERREMLRRFEMWLRASACKAPPDLDAVLALAHSALATREATPDRLETLEPLACEALEILAALDIAVAWELAPEIRAEIHALVPRLLAALAASAPDNSGERGG